MRSGSGRFFVASDRGQRTGKKNLLKKKKTPRREYVDGAHGHGRDAHIDAAGSGDLPSAWASAPCWRHDGFTGAASARFSGRPRRCCGIRHCHGDLCGGLRADRPAPRPVSSRRRTSPHALGQASCRWRWWACWCRPAPKRVLFPRLHSATTGRHEFFTINFTYSAPAGIAALHYVNPEIMGSLGIYMVIAVSILAALLRMKLRKRVNVRQASPMVWYGAASAVFAVLHYQPDLMGENAWLVVGAVFLFRTSRRGPHGKKQATSARRGGSTSPTTAWRSCSWRWNGPALGARRLYTVPMADLFGSGPSPAFFFNGHEA